MNQRKPKTGSFKNLNGGTAGESAWPLMHYTNNNIEVNETYFDPGVKLISYQDIICIMVDAYLFLAVAGVLERPVPDKIFKPFGSDSKANKPHIFELNMPKRLSKKYFWPLNKSEQKK